MNGYIIKNNFETNYHGIDSYNNKTWLDKVPEWNKYKPFEKIDIDEDFECFIDGNLDLNVIISFYQWIKQNGEYENAKLLFFQSDNLKFNTHTNHQFLGYDVVSLEDKEYNLRDYFYSSICHELLWDRIQNLYDDMIFYKNKLNQNELFKNLSDARDYLVYRNELYENDSKHIFETAFGTSYEIVKIFEYNR